MTQGADKHQRAQLREVGLTAFEINTLNEIAKQGGEVAWYPERVKPLTNQLVDLMVAKRLVEFLTSSMRSPIMSAMAPNVSTLVARYGNRFILRLTPDGRSALAALDAATSVKPIVNVEIT